MVNVPILICCRTFRKGNSSRYLDFLSQRYNRHDDESQSEVGTHPAFLRMLATVVRDTITRVVA